MDTVAEINGRIEAMLEGQRLPVFPVAKSEREIMEGVVSGLVQKVLTEGVEKVSGSSAQKEKSKKKEVVFVAKCAALAPNSHEVPIPAQRRHRHPLAKETNARDLTSRDPAAPVCDLGMPGSLEKVTLARFGERKSSISTDFRRRLFKRCAEKERGRSVPHEHLHASEKVLVDERLAISAPPHSEGQFIPEDEYEKMVRSGAIRVVTPESTPAMSRFHAAIHQIEKRLVKSLGQSKVELQKYFEHMDICQLNTITNVIFDDHRGMLSIELHVEGHIPPELAVYSHTVIPHNSPILQVFDIQDFPAGLNGNVTRFIVRETR